MQFPSIINLDSLVIKINFSAPEGPSISALQLASFAARLRFTASNIVEHSSPRGAANIPTLSEDISAAVCIFIDKGMRLLTASASRQL